MVDMRGTFLVKAMINSGSIVEYIEQLLQNLKDKV